MNIKNFQALNDSIFISASLYLSDLNILNSISWFDFRLDPSFVTAPVSWKNKAHFKSGQK